MNLNENRRLESFEISDDAGMADYLMAVCAELFDTHAAGTQFAKTPYGNCLDFEGLAESTPIDAAAAVIKHDKAKYFNDGALEQDLRRSGLTFTGSGKPVR